MSKEIEELEKEIVRTEEAIEMYVELANELREEVENWDDSYTHYNDDDEVETLEDVQSLLEFTEDDITRCKAELEELEEELEELNKRNEKE